MADQRAGNLNLYVDTGLSTGPPCLRAMAQFDLWEDCLAFASTQFFSLAWDMGDFTGAEKETLFSASVLSRIREQSCGIDVLATTINCTFCAFLS